MKNGIKLGTEVARDVCHIRFSVPEIPGRMFTLY